MLALLAVLLVFLALAVHDIVTAPDPATTPWPYVKQLVCDKGGSCALNPVQPEDLGRP
jgi:hypothetical protein